MGANTSNPYEDRTANEPVEDPRNPPPPPKPVVMNPKFVPPPDTQNPFDTASQQAERYADTPQPL